MVVQLYKIHSESVVPRFYLLEPDDAAAPDAGVENDADADGPERDAREDDRDLTST